MNRAQGPVAPWYFGGTRYIQICNRSFGVKNNNITYTTASHFPVPDIPKPLPKKLTPIKDQTQADVIFHATFRSSKAGMTSSILLQPRKIIL